MGKYDIPAAIDVILENTHSQKLYYIGHSMGTTMFWVALNEHPLLKEKISLMIGMGPVAKVKNMISPLRLLAPFVHEVDVSVNKFQSSRYILDYGIILHCKMPKFISYLNYFQYFFYLLSINLRF